MSKSRVRLVLSSAVMILTTGSACATGQPADSPSWVPGNYEYSAMLPNAGFVTGRIDIGPDGPTEMTSSLGGCQARRSPFQYTYFDCGGGSTEFRVHLNPGWKGEPPIVGSFRNLETGSSGELRLVSGPGDAQGTNTGVRVEVRTDAGTFEVLLDTVHAPITSANFLRYVDAGAYEGGYFHRTVRDENQPTDSVKIDVIQASRARDFEGFAPIPLERTSSTGLRHEDGAISMARGGPDTAMSDFFICVGPQPELDFGGARNPDGQGFAAFGRVVSGMDVVRRIHGAPAEGQALTPQIAILSMTRVSD